MQYLAISSYYLRLANDGDDVNDGGLHALIGCVNDGLEKYDFHDLSKFHFNDLINL